MTAVAIFGVAAVLITAHVGAYRKLSPFDEGVHFDYVLKITQGDVVTKGETLGQEAMREISCRGVDFRGIVAPPCEDGVTYDPEDFPNEGYNSADIHPPVYYLITGFLAKGLVAAGIAPDMLTAARLVGILWLSLGLLATWHLGRELGISDVPLALVLAAVASTPTLLHASATVTNDVAGVVAGGVLLLATVRFEKGRSPLWLLGLASFLALALKTTNIVTVGLCLLYLLLRRDPASGRGAGIRDGRRAGVAVLLGGALVALIGWLVLHSIMSDAVVTPMDENRGGLDPANVLANVTTLITPVNYGLPTSVLGANQFDTIGGVLGVLIIGATFYPLLRGSITEDRDRLAGSVGLVMLAGGGLFALASYVLFGEVIVSPRYGISLIPAVTVALAGAIRSRAMLWGLGVFAAGQLALVLGILVAT